MLITIQFLLKRPHVERVKVFGDPHQEVLFVYVGFLSVGIWRSEASKTLLKCMRELRHDKDWVANNWPIVRQARRRAYAKGRLQGITDQENWKAEWRKEVARRCEAERRIFELETAVRVLKDMSFKIELN